MLARPADRSLIAIGVLAVVLIGALVAAAAFVGRSSSATQDATGGDAKVPSVDVTLTGTVGSQTNAQGETEYTLTTPDGTLLLDAGPTWFFGDAYPLAPFVGRQVTIGGEQREGATQVEVVTVDGTALREPGKPPWAGGWKRVGERHPGWTQEKADRDAAKAAAKQQRFGLDCWPPGHCKDATGRPVTPGASPGP